MSKEKVAQTKKPSTPRKKRTKKGSGGSGLKFDIKKMHFFFNTPADTDAIVKRFFEEQLEYFCKNSRAINIFSYAAIRGVTDKRYYNWLGKYDWARNTHNQCKNLIAVRRSDMLQDLSIREKAVAHSLHAYCLEWKDANQYHSDLKANSQNKSVVLGDIIFKDYSKIKDIEEAKKVLTADPQYKEKDDD